MYESLPKNEKTFEIDVVGLDTGIQYTGQFTVKCILDMAARHSMDAFGPHAVVRLHPRLHGFGVRIGSTLEGLVMAMHGHRHSVMGREQHG